MFLQRSITWPKLSCIAVDWKLKNYKSKLAKVEQRIMSRILCRSNSQVKLEWHRSIRNSIYSSHWKRPSFLTLFEDFDASKEVFIKIVCLLCVEFVLRIQAGELCDRDCDRQHIYRNRFSFFLFANKRLVKYCRFSPVAVCELYFFFSEKKKAI